MIILDLGLPDLDGPGADPSRRASGANVAIVVLSSRGDERGKVEALDLGADDYVTKPFGMDELVARIRAALRHQLQVQGERPVFRSGDLSVDLVRRLVSVRGQGGEALAQGVRALRLLVQHAGKVLTHRVPAGRSGAPTDAQYLRVYVRQLRHEAATRGRAPGGKRRAAPTTAREQRKEQRRGGGSAPRPRRGNRGRVEGTKAARRAGGSEARVDGRGGGGGGGFAAGGGGGRRGGKGRSGRSCR